MFEEIFLLLSLSCSEQGSLDLYFLALACLFLQWKFWVFWYMLWDCPHESDTNLHIQQHSHDLAHARMFEFFFVFANYTHAKLNLIIILICIYLIDSEYVFMVGWFSWFSSKSPQRVLEWHFLWRGFTSAYLSLVSLRHFLRAALGTLLLTMSMTVQLEISSFQKLGPRVETPYVDSTE